MSLIDKLVKRVYAHRRYCVEVRDLRDPVPGPLSDLFTSFRLATADDISRLTVERHQYDDLRKGYALESLQDGNLCLIAEDCGEIVHIKWIAFDKLNFPPDPFPLAKGWAYFAEPFTVESHADRGLRRAGLLHAMRIARERGATLGVNMVFSGDTAAREIYKELGFHWLGDVDRRRILTKWWLQSNPSWLRGFLADPITEDQDAHLEEYERLERAAG